MQRLLKRLLRGIAPDFLKQAVKNHLQARLNGGRLYGIRLEPAGASLRCIVGPQWSFLAPEKARDNLVYHTTTREGLAELSGIARVAEKGGTLFDIGAHAGLISALFATAAPSNRVFSFEPSPLSQDPLKAIRRLNALEKRMTIEQVAIGAEKATLEMLLDPAGGFVQTQRFRHSMQAEPKLIRVQTETIGDAAERLGVIPDCVKIDIEGYEDEVIRGARDFLAAHRPTLLLELHLNYLEEKGSSARGVVDALSSCGYSFQSYGGQPLRPAQLYDSPLQSVRFLARAA